MVPGPIIEEYPDKDRYAELVKTLENSKIEHMIEPVERLESPHLEELYNMQMYRDIVEAIEGNFEKNLSNEKNLSKYFGDPNFFRALCVLTQEYSFDEALENKIEMSPQEFKYVKLFGIKHFKELSDDNKKKFLEECNTVYGEKLLQTIFNESISKSTNVAARQGLAAVEAAVGAPAAGGSKKKNKNNK